MFSQYLSWEWEEGGFPPAFKKQPNPKIIRKKNPTENPRNPTIVLSPKILQIQSLNFADCVVQFWFLRIFPHTGGMTWSFITAMIVSVSNILLRTSSSLSRNSPAFLLKVKTESFAFFLQIQTRQRGDPLHHPLKQISSQWLSHQD